MSNEFSFTYSNEDNDRNTYRVTVTNLKFKENDTGEVFQVLNLSAGGFCIKQWDREPQLAPGDRLTGDLLLNGKVYVGSLIVRVVRISNDLLGCEFVELDYRDEIRLDKLVLEIQKKLISRKKKAQAKEEDLGQEKP